MIELGHFPVGRDGFFARPVCSGERRALNALGSSSWASNCGSRAKIVGSHRQEERDRIRLTQQAIVAHLKSKGAHLAATEQSVDTSTATGKAFFDMLGVFAEFETNLRRERQAEGIASAKQRGVYRGRKPKIDLEAIQAKLIEGCSPTEIAREMGISRGTVYKAKAQMTLDLNGNGAAAS